MCLLGPALMYRSIEIILSINRKNIMSIVMLMNRNTFVQTFTPFLANTNKNFEGKLKYSIKKC